MARASIAPPGNREIHIAGFVTTKAGFNGGGKVVGIAVWITLALLILFINHQDAIDLIR
jgi:hypothetical protein